jgi:hypothetical protein
MQAHEVICNPYEWKDCKDILEELNTASSVSIKV